MPRFHFGKDEKAQLDGDRRRWPTSSPRVTGPSSPTSRSPSRTPSYLAERNKAHPDYLAAGWAMMTNKASPCLQCHAIGQFKPTAAARASSTGPTSARSRRGSGPSYLEAWLANPRRLVPFTAMPQNIAPHGDIQIPVPKTFENKPIDMVRAIRDTLLNYVNAVELQLASKRRTRRPAATPAGTPPKAVRQRSLIRKPLKNGCATLDLSRDQRRSHVRSLDSANRDRRA